MSLRTVPGMVNVKTPIGSAIAEFNRSRNAVTPEIKEGLIHPATDLHAEKRARMTKEMEAKSLAATKDQISGSSKKESCKSTPKCNCNLNEKKQESFGERAQVRGQNPNSIYSMNAPHIVEGWKPRDTGRTVKAALIVLIIVVAIMLIACMLMNSFKPKSTFTLTKINAYPDIPDEPKFTPIEPPLFGGKKAKKSKKSKKCKCGKCEHCLKKKAKRCTCGKCSKCLKRKAKKAKKTAKRLNEVYTDDEELI